MADIRKRTGKNGTTYQVRYPSRAVKSGYAFKSFNTLKEARAFCEDGQARRSAHALNPDVQTVESAVQLWLDVCEKEGRNGRDPVTDYTLTNYEYRADIIKRYSWEKQLHELTKPDIVAFRSWLLREYSRNVAGKALSSFRSVIREMLERGVLANDFAAGVTITAGSRYDEPVTVPTEADIRALLAAADRLANSKNEQIAKAWQRYRPMLYLAVDSGMRPQEYLALPKSNLSDTGVQVDRALDGSGSEITVTKTPSGRRFIDISPEALDMVRHYAEHHAAPNSHDLVFPTGSGKWQTVRTWRSKGFTRVCEEAGLIVEEEEQGVKIERLKYRPYDLRHFYASMLIDQRVNLKRIQTLMGHRNIQTTLNIYGHLIERAESSAEARTSVLTCMRADSCGKSVARTS